MLETEQQNKNAQGPAVMELRLVMGAGRREINK